MKREPVYPIVGMSYIVNDLSELIQYKINGQKRIILNTSAQPNSSPHFGTITTLMTVFALARHLENTLKMPVSVQFDELENSPGHRSENMEVIYYKSLCDSYNSEGIDLATWNMKEFKQIFEYLSQKTNIKYTIRKYSEFQSNQFVRETVINILKDKIFFQQLLSPKDNLLHIRTICPKCKFGKKSPGDLQLSIEGDAVTIFEKCPCHGAYSIVITPDNSTYIDINTQLRDLAKGIQLINDDRINNTLSVMVDGNDWAGTWAQRIHVEGMIRLGYKEFVLRLFTPTILDWSGAKLSKTLYVEKGAYEDVEPAFLNYDKFYKRFGSDGMEILWNEVQDWVKEPKKFFRNYTVDYFYFLLGLQK